MVAGGLTQENRQLLASIIELALAMRALQQDFAINNMHLEVQLELAQDRLIVAAFWGKKNSSTFGDTIVNLASRITSKGFRA